MLLHDVHVHVDVDAAAAAAVGIFCLFVSLFVNFWFYGIF